jgi:hypothetical protein
LLGEVGLEQRVQAPRRPREREAADRDHEEHDHEQGNEDPACYLDAASYARLITR